MTGLSEMSLFFEKKLFPLFFYYHLFKQYLINRKTLKLLLDNDTKIGRYSNLAEERKSDTIFILGSGSSVNDLSAEVWNEIKKNDSLGLNFWLVHEHVPDFYMFEAPRDADRRKVFSTLLNEKSESYAYKNCKFFVKDIHHGNFSSEIIPKAVKGNVFTFPQYSLIGRVLGSMESSFTKYFRLRIIGHDSVLLSNRATLFAALFFSWKMWYKNIVLVGIDLNNTSYFYESEKYRNSLTPGSGQTGSVHKTVDPCYGNVTLDQLVYMINERLLMPSGTSLFVASSKSLLYPKIPLYTV